MESQAGHQWITDLRGALSQLSSLLTQLQNLKDAYWADEGIKAIFDAEIGDNEENIPNQSGLSGAMVVNRNDINHILTLIGETSPSPSGLLGENTQADRQVFAKFVGASNM